MPNRHRIPWISGGSPVGYPSVRSGPRADLGVPIRVDDAQIWSGCSRAKTDEKGLSASSWGWIAVAYDNSCLPNPEIMLVFRESAARISDQGRADQGDLWGSLRHAGGNLALTPAKSMVQSMAKSIVFVCPLG